MKKSILKSVIVIFICVFIYVLFINLFIYPCITEGMSMFPKISPNEIKFTNRWSIVTNQELHRGDIITFEEPSVLYVSEDEFNQYDLVAKYDNQIYINPFRKRWMKRIIGLPNDHIQITDNYELYVNGEKVYESYVPYGYTNIEGGNYEAKKYMYIDLIVPENSVYVMGDNRSESTDSRSFGCIPINKVYSVLF